MTQITPALILALAPRHPDPVTAATKLGRAAVRYGITSNRQVAMFVAQLAHESGLVPVEENLNYSAPTMCRVWPGRFPTIASARPYARNPHALANKVYGGRGGNNNPGDGDRFHGRGLLQLTFKDNYRLYGSLVGFDLIAHPEWLLQYGVSALVAGAYWQRAGLNQAADRGNIQAVTRAINGGYIGLEERECLYQRACRITTRPLGLLGQDADEPEPDTFELDVQSDLDTRQDLFTHTLSLIAS